MIGHQSTPSQLNKSTANTDPDPAPPTCPRCGSPDVITTRCTSGPHWAAVRCCTCAWTTWAKKPWSTERARAFTLYFGRFRGAKLGDLIETEDGLAYVRWLATRDAGNAATAAGILLDQVENTRSDVSPSRKEKLAHERARRLRNAGPSGESTVCAVGRATGSTVLNRSTIDAPQS
jgi:hypothetical protein